MSGSTESARDRVRADAPSTLRLIVVAVLTMFALGLNWPIMSVGVRDVPPLWFAVIRLLGSGIILSAALRFRGGMVLPHRSDLPLVLSVATLRLAVNQGLIVVALTMVSAGRSSVLVYTSALWIAPLSVLILKERIAGRSVVAVGIGTTGVIVLMEPWSTTGERPMLGISLLLVSALAVALGSIHIRGHRWHGEQPTLMAWQLLLAGAVLIPFALALHGPPRFDLDGGVALILGYQIFVASLVGFWGSLTLARNLPAVTNGIVSLATPVVGIVSSSLFIDEQFDAIAVVGMVLVGGGVLLRLTDRGIADRPVRTPGM